MCGQHLIAAYQFCVDSLAIAGAQQPAEEHLTQPAADKPNPSVVYYIARGTHIKIGVTTDFVNRMGALQPDKVLAVEPGGRDLEKARHCQFSRAYLIGQRGRELFVRTEELLAHVEQVVAKYGRPPVTLEHEHWRWARHIEEVLAVQH